LGPVRNGNARPVADAAEAVPPRRGRHGGLPAALLVRRHAAAVGPQLPQLRPGPAGAPAPGPPVGPHQEQPDFSALAPLGRWLVPGPVVSVGPAPAARRRRPPGTDHRVHLRRPRPARLGREAPLADDLAGRAPAPGEALDYALPRALGRGTDHRRSQNPPVRTAGAAESDARRGGAGSLGLAVGALRGADVDG